MTYGDYQKYLADGGWEAVSMHEERLEVVSQHLGAHADLISRLQERVEVLEAGRGAVRCGAVRHVRARQAWCGVVRHGWAWLGAVWRGKA